MLPDEELNSLTARFSRFAEETRGRSPLYAHLSGAIADDPGIAGVLAAAAPRQRRPNLLFAAIHDVLLEGREHEGRGLAAYYPSLGGHRAPDRDVMPALRAFLHAHLDEVVARIATRTTQTNEPGRCAALFPALLHAAAGRRRPVTLVELGSSAGLLLHADRYTYRYDGGHDAHDGHDADGATGPGSSDTTVTIRCEARGSAPPLTGRLVVVRRIGLDLQPLSPSSPEDARWLRACVWPEDRARMARLTAALDVANRHDDVHAVAGDLVDGLVPTVSRVPDDSLACVVHSATLAYLDADRRAAVEDGLERLGAERDLARICFEGGFVAPFTAMEREAPSPPPDGERFLLGLTSWCAGRRSDELLARSHPHGAWLEWLGPSSHAG